jgi:hypothetical protein
MRGASKFVLKLVDPFSQSKKIEIRQSKIYYAGSLGRLYKRIVDQGFDVQSIIFFHDFVAEFFAKILSIYFFIFLSFECPKSIKSLKKKILGTSD